ncbi:MAG: helix-turn-helix domain-containing protein [Gammaproteobacteria bacterium]|nr:helix-turn-helix domain-containing protein [Gammaproteobacteria bacterium]
MAVLADLKQIQALAHPIRVRVLDALRSPNSAAGVARAIGGSRQNVNYHLKELERAGLVRHAGERRKGNFVEQLFQSIAKRFVVSSRFAWDQERLGTALADQASLARLQDLGETLQRDAAGLIDRAAFDGEEIPSATVDAEVRFADSEARANFLEEYIELLKPLLAKYKSSSGLLYRVAMAAYPFKEDI